MKSSAVQWAFYSKLHTNARPRFLRLLDIERAFYNEFARGERAPRVNLGNLDPIDSTLGPIETIGSAALEPGGVPTGASRGGRSGGARSSGTEVELNSIDSSRECERESGAQSQSAHVAPPTTTEGALLCNDDGQTDVSDRDGDGDRNGDRDRERGTLFVIEPFCPARCQSGGGLATRGVAGAHKWPNFSAVVLIQSARYVRQQW